MLTNCKNCGAPLCTNEDSLKCEYCGTEYEYIPDITDYKQVIKLRIGPTIRKFYISTIECYPESIDTTTLCDNTKCAYIVDNKLELTLISYD